MSKLKKDLTYFWRKGRQKLGGISKRGTALPHGPLHAQAQSLLFSKLPPELRLYIYTIVLIKSNRFMHILHQIPDQGELACLGHWPCDDAGKYHMVWQHRCFGPYVEVYGQISYIDMKRTSNTKLLSLLLSCRAIYEEARDVLYAQSTFNFRGAGGLIRFNESLTRPNWQLIRHIHISTIFRTPMEDSPECRYAPESYVCWGNACALLRTLDNLHSIGLEIAVWYELGRDGADCPDDGSLLVIFEGLMSVRARTFEVQLNVDLPDSVTNVLGNTPFELIRYERPVDWDPSRVGD